MKRFLGIMMILVLVFAMTACTKEQEVGGDTEGDPNIDKPSELPLFSQGLTEEGFFEGVTATDFVTLGQYDAISVPADVVTFTDEDVEAEIEGLLSYYTDYVEVTDRAAKIGDVVDIDYAGYMDGDQFEGGTGNNPNLELGSGGFIDGFEDGVIGHKVGDSFELELSFPDPYHNQDLAGKPVTFLVTLNGIYELVEPTLTEAFVAETLQADYGWTTIEDVYEGIRSDLKDNAIYNYVMTTVEAYEVSEVPQSMVEYQQNSLVDSYSQMMAMYGMTMDDLFSSMGVASLEEFLALYEEQHIEAARSSLILQAIAEDAGLKVEQADLDEEFSDMEEEEYQSVVEYYGINYIKQVLLMYKVQDYLVKNAIVE